MLRVFDMFSGFGGFHQACEKAGMEIVAYCEINKWAKKFYNQAFNTEGVKCFDDATKINTRELPNFDLLCAGFPCQAFSIAGKRQGFNDTRGTLFFEVARILKDKRPRYFVLENVKGLLNHEGGKTFVTIIKTLSDLGYNVEWALLNSKYFGVPQNRERVFIVGYLEKGSAGKIFPLGCANGSHNKETPPPQDVIYWKNSKEQWVEEQRQNVGTIKTQSDLCRQPLIKIGSLRTAGEKGLRLMAENISPCEHARAREDGSHQPVILQYARGNNKGGEHQVCTTITKNQWEYNNVLKDNCKIRRLTPLECFRLQGFSDEVFYKGSKGISDAQLYKGAGNSVTVNVVYEIVKKIVEVNKCGE